MSWYHEFCYILPFYDYVFVAIVYLLIGIVFTFEIVMFTLFAKYETQDCPEVGMLFD